MANALSLTFEDDDLLGPATSIVPELAVTCSHQPASLAEHRSVQSTTAASSTKQASGFAASADQAGHAGGSKDTSNLYNVPTLSTKSSFEADFMLSQLSMTGPAFEYSIPNTQEKSQQQSLATSHVQGRGQRRQRVDKDIQSTLTQSPIKRSRPDTPSHSGVYTTAASASSAKQPLSATLSQTAHAQTSAAAHTTPQSGNIRRIPGPAGVVDALPEGGVVEGINDISTTQQHGAPSDSSVPPPSFERETVVEEWLSSGAWRQMCIDLDLPPAAAPLGLYPAGASGVPAQSGARAASAVIPLKRFQQQAGGNSRMCWKSVPGLSVLVTAFRSTAAGGLAVVQDWSGCVRALIARDVLQDFGNAVAVGSCLALVGVSIVQPAPGKLYLNVRSTCIARVYPPDCPQPKLRCSQQQHSQII